MPQNWGIFLYKKNGNFKENAIIDDKAVSVSALKISSMNSSF